MFGRFSRQVALFGESGQELIRAARVVVVGAGGLGSHVVQQLALLGAGHISVVDAEELDDTNKNRYVTARFDDPVPGTKKVDIACRLIKSIDPSIEAKAIPMSLVMPASINAIVRATHVVGCVDSEGARLVMNEMCAAYKVPFVDMATDILPEDQVRYGGRVCISTWEEAGCLACRGLIDFEEAQLDLLPSAAKRDRDRIYGVERSMLSRSGPSVVSINGVVASLGVTELMVMMTRLRKPMPISTYYGNSGKVTVNVDVPGGDCYYCNGVRGSGIEADLERYAREGILI